MAINIPASVFTTYNEAVLLFTRTATLVYPEKENSVQTVHGHYGNSIRSISN